MSTSAAEATGDRAKTWPVLGLTSSAVRPSTVSTWAPPTKLRRVRGLVLTEGSFGVAGGRYDRERSRHGTVLNSERPP